MYDRGIFSIDDKNRVKALLAFPSTGGAVKRIFTVPSGRISMISFVFALGVTLIFNMPLGSDLGRFSLMIFRSASEGNQQTGQNKFKDLNENDSYQWAEVHHPRLGHNSPDRI
jgi:hypothetical protein